MIYLIAVNQSYIHDTSETSLKIFKELQNMELIMDIFLSQKKIWIVYSNLSCAANTKHFCSVF
jgi:hypothetical protein